MPIPPFAVPAITSAEAKKLHQIFKPIKIKGDKAFLIDTKDLHNSFLWDADKHLKPYKGDLYTLYRFHSVHAFGYHGMFKPSIAEVLAQIPRQYAFLKEAYFETIGPEDAHDLNMWQEHVGAGVHVARTTLYVPEPSLEVMARIYHAHPESLSMDVRVSPAASAVRWLEAMKPEDRVQAMNFFCEKCGDLLGQDQPVVVGATKKNPCPKCEKK